VYKILQCKYVLNVHKQGKSKNKKMTLLIYLKKHFSLNTEEAFTWLEKMILRSSGMLMVIFIQLPKSVAETHKFQR